MGSLVKGWFLVLAACKVALIFHFRPLGMIKSSGALSGYFSHLVGLLKTNGCVSVDLIPCGLTSLLDPKSGT
jgi:hypothetical protein